MASGFDSASSTLLCTEDNSIFDDTWRPRNNERKHHFSNPYVLPLQSEECLALMLEKECQHWHGSHYLNRLRSGNLDIGLRIEAIHWIQEVRSHFGFGPLCAYLSINYLDRFLAAYELPKGRPWTMQLLAVACLSLAAKVDETNVPPALNLQVGKAKFVFEAKTIQRMEFLVLNTLKWRMQAITPFSFIDYFLCKINGGQSPLRSLILQSIQLITSTVKGIDFLEFKPSEIAAALAMYVAGETQKTVDSGKTFSVLIQYVEKERLLKCVEMIQVLATKDSSDSIQCLPENPLNGVLDALCNKSASPQNSPDAKRRKPNETS